jgi:hypothetical protein
VLLSASSLRAFALSGVLVASLVATGCEACPFQIVSVQTVRGTLAPGGFAVHDVTIAAEESLEIDLANSSTTAAGRRVDAWLVGPDCAQLFNEPYPGPSGALPPALCPVLLGPVAPDSVSARQKSTPGVHRVFLQAWASNSSEAEYDVESGTWGRTCRQILLNRRR